MAATINQYRDARSGFAPEDGKNMPAPYRHPKTLRTAPCRSMAIIHCHNSAAIDARSLIVRISQSA
jgi:hypothetical protein